MPLIQTTYFHIECNGPAATPFKDHCSAEVDGSWDQQDVESRAAQDGWAKEGRSWFCSRHKSVAAADTSKPKRTPKASAPAPDLHES
jgi:hypothetical protein